MAPKSSGGPPPPPPISAGKLLTRNHSIGKLKKSSIMSNLFRDLRIKLEGSRLQIKITSRTRKQLGGSAGGKEGLAASLLELTQRSPFFKQIEEDVEKYGKTILELKASINSFETKDMNELVKFQQDMDYILEDLTDESQVLAKFEDFPTKKMETIRAAAALFSKANSIVSKLKSWEVKSPSAQLLIRFDRYFTKIKTELDAIERTKDEESRTFKRHGIDFDFNIFVTIKELMVDVSSNCMELVLKEWRETRGATCNADVQKKVNKNLLWRAFQMAFRVYSFAGGNDDRADKLARELANEILSDS